jgi:hypothetical protein
VGAAFVEYAGADPAVPSSRADDSGGHGTARFAHSSGVTKRGPVRPTLEAMSDTKNVTATGATGTPPVVTQPRRPSAWVGMVVFAGVMLLLVGAWEAMLGLIALFNSTYYLVSPSGMVASVDYTVWGWVHLVLGALAVLAGFGVLAGRMWARVTGIVLAALVAIANIAFIPAYPVGSVILVTAAVLVIYALAAHGKEIREDDEA